MAKVQYGPAQWTKDSPRLHCVADERKYVGIGGPVKVYRKVSEVRKIRNEREAVKNGKGQIIGYNEIFPEATPAQYAKLSFCPYVEEVKQSAK